MRYVGLRAALVRRIELSLNFSDLFLDISNESHTNYISSMRFFVFIVQVINKNTLRWFDHAMRREDESTPMAVTKLNMKGMRPRGRPILRWLDNIDSPLKGKNTTLKEVLERK